MGIRVLKMGLGGPGVGVLGWARKDDGGRAGGRVMISSVCNICFFYVWEDCCCWGELGKVYGVRLKGIPQGFGLGGGLHEIMWRPFLLASLFCR